MVVFLANRANLQSKRLHDRIKDRLSADLQDVRRRRADPREAGPYRIVGEVNPRPFLGDDAYPTTIARVEVGFQFRTDEPYEYYWFNWVEPDRSMLVGWHQDGTHDNLGPVHLQVNDGSTPIDRQPARFVDSHPLDVVEQRFGELEKTVRGVEWEDGQPTGLDLSASSN